MIYYTFFAAPRSMRDLSSATRDRTHTPAMEAQSPNYWTARELPKLHYYILLFFHL